MSNDPLLPKYIYFSKIAYAYFFNYMYNGTLVNDGKIFQYCRR